MINLEQLVQDVHDGNEDPIKAWNIIFEELQRVNKCLEEIKPIVEKAKNER